MRNLLLSSVTLLLIPAVSFAASDFTAQTHTDTPMELKPISLISGTKLAAVCFLGNGNCGDGGFNAGDSEYKIDTEQQCKNEGFTTTSCNLPAYPDSVCPYNDAYYAKCTDDKPKACRENGYPVLSCGVGEVVDTACPYDSSYKKCKCDPCDGYDYTYAQATAQGYVTDGSCRSCSETKYRRKANPCAGYSTCECGGATGAAVCYSASAQKFNSCKPCCRDVCPSGYSLTLYSGCYDTAATECGTTCYKEKSCCYEAVTGKQVYGSCYCHPNSYWYPIDGYSTCCSISYTIYYDDGQIESGDELRNCGGDERDPSSCDSIISGNCSYMEGRETNVYETICD